MKTDNQRDIPPAAAPEGIQRMFEDMGLGTEAERQYFRDLGHWPNYGHLPKPKERGYYVLRWFTDERELALDSLREQLEERRRA